MILIAHLCKRSLVYSIFAIIESNELCMKKTYVLFVRLLFLCFGHLCAQEAPGYFMDPTVHGETIVFAAEGDLWRVDVTGGRATRLTTHQGIESSPKISPDGQWLAYAAAYEGPTEVYIMPMSGGLPRRLTYEPMASVPTAWKSITELAYVTSQYSTLPRLKTVLLDIDKGDKTIIPLEMAAEGSFDASGNTYFFVRPTYHNNVTKRYEGGTARQIWKYSKDQAEAERFINDYLGEDHHPTYHQERVYFVSSRDGIQNVWSMNIEGADLLQHTRQLIFDVREFSLHGDRLVYRVGADLYMHSLETGAEHKLSITLMSDYDQLREKWVDNPMRYLTHAAVSNNGENVVLTARGRVFVFPTKTGRRLRLDQNNGVRHREAIFSTDDKDIYSFSDESGEFEIVRHGSLGLNTAKALTTNGTTLRVGLTPSPDGQKLVWYDLDNVIWLLDIQSGTVRRINSSDEDLSGQIDWSPDSKYIVYGQSALNTFMQLFIYDIAGDRTIPLTTDRTNNLSPQWSADGRWIYFISDRNFTSKVGSPWGPRQPEPFWEDQMKIYHIGLQKGVTSPFAEATELTNTAKVQEDSVVSVRIDEDGLIARVREVPIPAGNYKNLVVTKKALYYLRVGAGVGVYFGGGASSDEDPAVMMTSLDAKAEPKVYAEKINNFTTSLNKKYILMQKGSKHYVTELGTSPVSDISKAEVDIANWTFPIDPREDWRQIYTDAWRMERDYFYDKGMHGVDWDAMYAKYFPLVDRVTSRHELSDVLGELIGELSVLHTSVNGGDIRRGEDNINMGLLGANFSRAQGEDGFVIDHIYRGDPDYPDELSPLDLTDVAIEKGDILTHIDGVSLTTVPHPNALLREKIGRQVRISIINSRDRTKADVVVKPISSREEANLRYNEWEYTRRLMTESYSQGEIGYVHLRAMTSSDIGQWYRDFYPQFNKGGLIVDVRHNRGGNIDSFILEKLMRQAFFYWKSRTGQPYWNMNYAFRGHLVILVDEFTASDGEAFAEGFRRLGLGKAIGVRTWGGEVWLSGVNTLTDNGIARAPMNGVYGAEGEWLIEGIGFIPDIEILNKPKETFDGRDAQLEAAILHLQELIKADPRTIPLPPEYPNKSFRNSRN